jgi:hypothetical protein
LCNIAAKQLGGDLEQMWQSTRAPSTRYKAELEGPPVTSKEIAPRPRDKKVSTVHLFVLFGSFLRQAAMACSDRRHFLGVSDTKRRPSAERPDLPSSHPGLAPRPGRCRCRSYSVPTEYSLCAH